MNTRNRRLLLISATLLIFISTLVSGQVVNFAKTLPERAFSVGITPAYHFDYNVILFDAGGPAIGVNAGYGLQYPLDFNARYIYFFNGADYFGLDLQYLLHEARYSYFSVIAGLHRWEEYGFDLTGLYTYSPRYFLNLSVGLDMDLSFATEINPRFWLPVNVGLNINEMTFLYAEFNLPVSERAWSIVALGATFIFR
jgi:hypothetical protein